MDYRIDQKGALRFLVKKETIYLNSNMIPLFWEHCAATGSIEVLRSLSNHPQQALFGITDFTSYQNGSVDYYIGTPYRGMEFPDGFERKSLPRSLWVILRQPDLQKYDGTQLITQLVHSDIIPNLGFNPSGMHIELYPDSESAQLGQFSEAWISVAPRQQPMSSNDEQ